jgi:uncharacterized membrane protein YheB (UPF0754 family)
MKFLVPILLGAVIGYITNWLAIKMLFRPHYEKRIFGLPIPFTPGLIPKEKNRIAKSLGETIGVHLLTSDVMIKAFLNDEIDHKIREWLVNNVEKLKKSNIKIKTLFVNFKDGDYTKLSNIIKTRLVYFILSKLKEQKFKDGLMTIIENAMENIMYNKHEKHGEDIFKTLKGKIGIFIHKILTPEEIETILKNTISNKVRELESDTRSLSTIISKDVISTLNLYIVKHSKDIQNILSEIFKNPSVKKNLRASISELISENTNKFITLFLKSDTFAEKILSSLENYLNSPNSNKDITLVMITLVNNFLQKELSSIIMGISIEEQENYIQKTATIISGYISNRENQNKLLNFLEGKINESKDNIKENLLSIISDKIEDIINNPGFIKTIDSILNHTIEMVLEEPLASIVKDVDNDIIDTVSILSKDIFHSLIKNKLPHIIELLNISRVVEDQINSFDVTYVEQIIIEIANRELKAITWLGALLGGIMGMLLPFLKI